MSDCVSPPDFSVSSEIRAALDQPGRVLIMGHHNPDGDALGSSSALARTLGDKGFECRLYLPGEWSDNLNFLMEGLSADPEPKASDYDLIFILDCHDYDRFGPAGPKLAEELKALPTVVIDHHLLSEGEKSGAMWIHHPRASSTGELVWRMLADLGWRPSKEAAQRLLLAIASDTGFFGQSNTTPDCLRASADLLELGGDLTEIKRRIMFDQPLRRMKLMGLALDSLELHFDGRLAAMIVDPAMLKMVGAGMADTENFVELGRSLAGVRLSVLIKDEGRGPGSIRVSLRSRDDVDARSLAMLFGGGGHTQAAAYNDGRAGSAEEALKNILAEAERFL